MVPDDVFERTAELLARLAELSVEASTSQRLAISRIGRSSP